MRVRTTLEGQNENERERVRIEQDQNKSESDEAGNRIIIEQKRMKNDCLTPAGPPAPAFPPAEALEAGTVQG